MKKNIYILNLRYSKNIMICVPLTNGDVKYFSRNSYGSLLAAKRAAQLFLKNNSV